MKKSHTQRRILCNMVAILAGITLSANPEAKETMYYGVLKWTEMNPSCTQGLSPVNAIQNSSFHPKEVTGNHDFSALNIFWPFGGISWTLYNGSFTSTFQYASTQGIGWSGYTASQPSFIKITSQNPATLKNTTQSVTLVGQIQNPTGMPGQDNCMVTFRMNGMLKLE